MSPNDLQRLAGARPRQINEQFREKVLSYKYVKHTVRRTIIHTRISRGV